MTARQIIEARLGRSLGPIATMPRDLRCALYALALQLQRMRKGMTDTTDETIRAMSDEELFAQINGYDPYAVEFARRFLALRQERNGLRKRLDVYEGRRCGPLRITGVVDDMAGALTELARAGQEWDAAPKVKPLVWDDFGERGAKASAWRSANYMITRWSDGSFDLVESYPGYSGRSIAEPRYTTLEAAKAAAQADYKRRILEALE